MRGAEQVFTASYRRMSVAEPCRYESSIITRRPIDRRQRHHQPGRRNRSQDEAAEIAQSSGQINWEKMVRRKWLGLRLKRWLAAKKAQSTTSAGVIKSGSGSLSDP